MRGQHDHSGDPHMATQILLARLVTTAPPFCLPGRRPKWPLRLIQSAGLLYEVI
jgi:hypothetical protein